MADTGKRLKIIRTHLGINQGEFAEKMGISQGALSDFEREAKPMAERYYNLVCLTFGVNDVWLRTGEGEMFTKKTETPPEKVEDRNVPYGYNLKPDEEELIRIYERLFPETKQKVREYAKDKLDLQEMRKKNGAAKVEKGELLGNGG